MQQSAMPPSRPLRWSALIRGTPGHPLHPPFTDAVIGMFFLASGLAVVGYAGAIPDAAGKGMWLALVGGLAAALGAATTGFADWILLEWGSPRWRTATLHLSAMVTAVALFALAAWRQYPGYQHGGVTTGGLALTLAGLVVLTAGGWLGGTLVFVHGVRVQAAGGDLGAEPPATLAPDQQHSGGQAT
jgi:uncharacterized membrane protein